MTVAVTERETTMNSIRQTVRFAASPARVYETLMDSSRHTAFTGEPATVSRAIGGASSAYGGKVTAINLDLVANKRIVQAWRSAQFPEGGFSLATFQLNEVGSETELVFSQDAIPEGFAEHLDKGWNERYWAPLRKYLET